MTISRTTWRPDTCGCRVDFGAVTDLPDSDVPTWRDTRETCPEHVGFSGQALYERILAENRRKNVSFTLAKEIDVDLVLADFIWSFIVGDQPVRKLLLSMPTFNPPKRNDLQDACDLQFGPNLVVVS